MEKMRGYPKHCNTKEDILIALDIDPQRAKAFLKDAIDHRKGWYVTGPLESEAEGFTDETHRVIDQSDEESPADWYQEEYGPIPGNLVDRLGLSIQEAETLIGDI
jgi:hypothetical protein